MLTALLYGLATAAPLVAGAAIGLRWQLPKAVLGALMAFGAGTMIAAVSAELFELAFHRAGAVIAALALLAGGLPRGWLVDRNGYGGRVSRRLRARRPSGQRAGDNRVQ